MPTTQMRSSARFLALPLSGSLAYAYASTKIPMDLQCTSSIERRLVRAAEFLVPRQVPQHEPGEREMLMYGKMYLPSTCIDAVFAQRLSPTHQLLVTALSTAPTYPIRNISRWFGIKQRAPPPLPGGAFGPPGTTGLQVTLQNILPRTFMEYSYSLDDALWGIRALRKLSWPYVDEHRLSVGAELFFSAAVKSAGLSAGIRYWTEKGLFSEPDTAPMPAAATLNINPIMGHMRIAYAAMVTKDLSMCSRYDLNVFSYESDLAFGAEYLLRSAQEAPRTETKWVRETEGVWAPVHEDSRLSLREPPEKEPVAEALSQQHDSRPQVPRPQQNSVLGVIKGRVSTSGVVAFLWEGHWRQFLMSVGLRTRMQPSRRQLQPVLGIELMYVGDGETHDSSESVI